MIRAAVAAFAGMVSFIFDCIRFCLACASAAGFPFKKVIMKVIGAKFRF